MEAERTNLEIIRSMLDGYQHRDWETVRETLDPDVELFPIRAVFEGTPYRGHDGFRQFVDDAVEDWDDFGLEAEELYELEGGRVLVVADFRARGKASGVEFATRAAWLCELRGGKVIKLRFYPDEEAARAALAR
jgi:ketosteroid isomerase-like protein